MTILAPSRALASALAAGEFRRDNGGVMQDIPYWARALALVVLLVIVAAVDMWYRRGKSTRWKEYSFILAAGLAAGVFGMVTDLITSSISPDYFIFGKQLPAEKIRLSAMLLGLQAGSSAGVIAGAMCVFVGSRKGAGSRLPVGRIAMLSWRPLALAVAFAAAFPLVCGWFDPFNFVVRLGPALGEIRARKFLVVWHIHCGVYLGLAVGAMWMIVSMMRISRSARSQN